MEQQKEMVNHPNHYNDFDVEVIDMMLKIWGYEEVMSFCKLNAFKYRMRAGLKNDAYEDLKKAEWYITKYHDLSHVLLVDDMTKDEMNDEFKFYEDKYIK